MADGAGPGVSDSACYGSCAVTESDSRNICRERAPDVVATSTRGPCCGILLRAHCDDGNDVAKGRPNPQSTQHRNPCARRSVAQEHLHFLNELIRLDDDVVHGIRERRSDRRIDSAQDELPIASPCSGIIRTELRKHVIVGNPVDRSSAPDIAGKTAPWICLRMIN